jgi:TetR/AcrR family transcriptional regulator, mexJK operon transcriptional repressor
MASMIERSERNEPPTIGKVESILAAAKRMFLESGFGAVSMDAIARAAGVSKATVYAHFAGKDELFGAVIGRECERYFAEFSADELDPGKLRASLTTLARRFLDLLLSPDAIALHRLIVGEVSRFPALGEVFWRAGPERNLAQIEAFLRTAVAAGVLDIADPRLAAEQFTGLVRGETQLRHLLRLENGPNPAKIAALVDAAVETFLRAFDPRGTSAHRRQAASTQAVSELSRL